MKLIPESEADKTKDVFVGLWRPPLAYVMNHVTVRSDFVGVHDSECFGRLNENGEPTGVFKSEQRVKERWMVGDFDSCLYQRIVRQSDTQELESKLENLSNAVNDYLDKNFGLLDHQQPEFIALRNVVKQSK